MSTRYMVCYDVVDDRSREKVRRLLSGYGERVQYSMFDCSFSEAALKDLSERLFELIDVKKDSVRFYPLCLACVKRLIVDGNWSSEPDEGFVLV